MIGKGGYGKVYEAADPRCQEECKNKHCAIKEAFNSLESEYTILKHLNPSSIAPKMYALWKCSDFYYRMLMDEIKGKRLGDWANETKKEEQTVLAAKLLTKIKKIQNVCKQTCRLNAAFVNWYSSNETNIPWHRDKTHKDYFIASFCFVSATIKHMKLSV